MTVLASPVRRAAVVFGGLLTAPGCASEPPVSEGQALFEVHCMACHGVGALGDGPMAAALPVQPASLLEHLGHHTRAQLNQLIRSGVPPAMPPAALSEDQVELVVEYVWTLVPESEVAALRAMQAQVEATGMGAMSGMAGMAMDATVAPPVGAQEFAFSGTVRSVDPQAGTVAVQNDEIPGWMSAMSMTYSVDAPSILQSLEAGDRITARVYAGDFRTLYGVQVAPE